MNEDFLAAMRRATLSTRSLNMAEATRAIQDALTGCATPGGRQDATAEIEVPPPRSGPKPFPVDPDAVLVEPAEAVKASPSLPERPARPTRLRKPLGETLRILREGRLTAGPPFPRPDLGLAGTAGRAAGPALPVGAHFQARVFNDTAGTRNYRLYIPAASGTLRGLVVMLHGCKQTPEDFAFGTGMNAVAEANGLLVAYPEQTCADNASSCWNWFRPEDQRRNGGEPSIIAGITSEIMSEFGIAHRHVFVAGLSAGGAMAAVMGETYPDIYAAVGIHSGLAYGAANDVMSALAAMRGQAGLPPRGHSRRAAGARDPVRTIIFHGSADATVHPSNAERIVAAVKSHGADLTAHTQTERSAGGRNSARKVLVDQAGLPIVEQWLVDGAGHAWFGGRAAGSYTDPTGPDASTEMVRFFLGGST